MSTEHLDTASGCPVDHGGATQTHHGFEPFAMNDPFPSYAELRREEPVMYDERIGCWVVTRHEDVKAVFGDWETFSSENAQKPVRERGPEARRIMEDGGFTAYSGLSARVPPEHTRIRGIAQKAFTPRRYKRMEPEIHENVRRLIRQMLENPDRRGEIVRDIARDVPTITILTLFGEDVDQVNDFKRWSDSRGVMTWGNLSDEEQVPHAHNLVEYWQRCLSLVEKAHAEGGDNLVADLVQAQEGGAQISDHEIASLCYSLLFAGHETTTTLIANSLRVLLSHPDQWERLVEDRSLIPSAVEEILRYSGSIVSWHRKALRDAEVGGVSIPKGAELLLVMGSANRDEDLFEDSESFDVERGNSREHLSFGYGIHYCLGNMLAKLQARIVLEEVLEMAPHLELENPGDIRFGDNLSFRAPVAVPVIWKA